MGLFQHLSEKIDEVFFRKLPNSPQLSFFLRIGNDREVELLKQRFDTIGVTG